ncbi:hypothetical protein J6590_077761 [Homalodisca vitripennis]|nr:hypothetical protein J6590_077761 [Homalodisca vitripennis]
MRRFWAGLASDSQVSAAAETTQAQQAVRQQQPSPPLSFRPAALYPAIADACHPCQPVSSDIVDIEELERFIFLAFYKEKTLEEGVGRMVYYCCRQSNHPSPESSHRNTPGPPSRPVDIHSQPRFFDASSSASEAPDEATGVGTSSEFVVASRSGFVAATGVGFSPVDAWNAVVSPAGELIDVEDLDGVALSAGSGP